MTDYPRLTDEQLASIRAYHERTTHPAWSEETHVGQLLAEVDRLRAIDVAVLQVMDRIKAHADQGGETVLFRVLSDLAVARGLGRAPETNTWQES